MSKNNGKVITHRWQFVPETFAGWPDGRPWTRVEPGGDHRGLTMPEGPDGPVYRMGQKYIDMIAGYLDDMVRTFEVQRNESEAAWHRGRTRSPERPMLVRMRLPVLEVPSVIEPTGPAPPTEAAP